VILKYCQEFFKIEEFLRL